MMNARTLSMSLWRPWPGIENRCLVPAMSFVEWTPEPNPATVKKETVWFDFLKDTGDLRGEGVSRGFYRSAESRGTGASA